MAATGLSPADNLVPSQLIAPGVPSATPYDIPAASGNPGTDFYRLYNPASRVGNGQYPNPVAMPDNSNLHDASAGFNQAMMEISQHFEPMIQLSVMNQPRWWHDRIPRTAYKLFNGAVHETRIFRGALMKYAGLDEWQDIDPYPTATNNPCGAMGFNTPTYGWEAISWRGKRSAWGSDPVCADQFKFFDEAQQQLAWILSAGAEYGIQMQEVWNRDMFIYQSVVFKRSFLMSSEYTGKATSGRYYYDPFTKFDGAGNGSEGHALAAVVKKAFILFPADTDVESLNFDVLDKVRQSLEIRCPSGAVSNVGGLKTYAIALSADDVEKYVRGNEEERKLWIEANPEALIKHYNFTTPIFRRWSIVNDGNQLRFKRTKLIKSFSATDALNYGVGSGDAAWLIAAGDVWVAAAVDPLVKSETRPGVNGTTVPEDNPDYIDAELAIAPVFMNQIFENQMVPSITTLGSGTKFGPAPGLNGAWRWINILDRETNPLGNVGNFYGTFEIVPKPNANVFHSISFLYKRCNVALPSFCPSDNSAINPVLQTSSKVAADAEIADGATSAIVRFEDMLKAAAGDTLTLMALLGKKYTITGAGSYDTPTRDSLTLEFALASDSTTAGTYTLKADGSTVGTSAGTVANGVPNYAADFASPGIKFGSETDYVQLVLGTNTSAAALACTVFGAPTPKTLEVQFAAQKVLPGETLKITKADNASVAVS